MRLQAEGPPDARHHGLAHPNPAGHVACRPVGRACRLLLKRERDHLLDHLVADPARCSAARRIHQAVQPMRHEALPPGDHALAADAQMGGDRLVGRLRLGIGRQHDPRPHDCGLTRTTPPHEPLQRIALPSREHHRNRFWSTRHGCLLSEAPEPIPHAKVRELLTHTNRGCYGSDSKPLISLALCFCFSVKDCLLSRG